MKASLLFVRSTKSWLFDQLISPLPRLFNVQIELYDLRVHYSTSTSPCTRSERGKNLAIYFLNSSKWFSKAVNTSSFSTHSGIVKFFLLVLYFHSSTRDPLRVYIFFSNSIITKTAVKRQRIRQIKARKLIEFSRSSSLVFPFRIIYLDCVA